MAQLQAYIGCAAEASITYLHIAKPERRNVFFIYTLLNSHRGKGFLVCGVATKFKFSELVGSLASSSLIFN